MKFASWYKVRSAAKDRISLAWYLVFLAIAPCAFTETSPEQALPLKPGNYWVYTGTVSWSCNVPGHPGHVCRKQIVWKSEIVEEQARGSLRAYLVNGSFDDLPWYAPGTKPHRYLWIVYANRFYTLHADADLLRRFHDPKDAMVDLIEKEQPVLQFPLQPGQCARELKPESGQVGDSSYCWYVEKKESRQVKVASYNPDPKQAVWSVVYRTAPDDEELKFAPGVGFVAFDYSHHGTVSEAHVQLTDIRLR